MGCEWVLLITLLSALVVEAKMRNTDAFMSSIDLKNMFRMEMAMVEVLRQQKAQLEAGLQSIRHYTSQVEDLYSGENCWPPDKCDDSQILQKIVGNPIYNYQMLKRLLYSWKTMEDDLKKIDTKRNLFQILF